jgi:diguanylate cyclase (GGDEF)-like protein
MGLLVSLAPPAGWLLLRWALGRPPRQELSAHGGVYAYMCCSTVVAVTAFGYLLGRVEEALRRANRRLLNLATTDELTSLANARVFHFELPRWISLARRAGLSLALVVLDVDYFKELNDSRGHAVGDAVLRAIGLALRQGRRREDVVARVGGEEFALILPGVDLASAGAVAERVLQSVRTLQFAELPGVHTTISAGVAVLEARDTPESLFERADAALYHAKSAGRDRVITAPPTSLAPTLATR